ncbi:MAG: VCBS repeat-containing protein [Planctomycetota bacterium]
MLALPLALLAAPQAVEAADLGGTVLRPAATEIVDFDGDGTLDVLALDSLYGRVTWSRGLGGRDFADAAVLARLLPEVPTFPLPLLAVADLNVDGQLDLVAATAFGGSDRVVAVALVDPVTLEANVTEVTRDNGLLQGVLVVDATLDGLPDIVFEGFGFRSQILVQLPGGGFADAEPLLDPMETVASGLIQADLDGDGDEDLVAAGLSTPSGGVPVSAWIETTGVVPYPTTLVTVLGPELAELRAGDLDADGDIDLVGTGESTGFAPVILENLGSSFAPPRPIVPGASQGASIRVIDIEGDGDLDVYAGQALWTNDGNGVFVEQTAPLPSSGIQADSIGDLDGDGNADGLSRTLDNGARPGDLRLGWGRVGPSGFEFESGESLNEAFGDQPVQPLQANGDGLPDLLVSNDPGFGLSPIVGWKRALGAGEYARIEVLYTGPTQTTPSYAAGDFDGDGDDDVLLSEGGSRDVLLYENDGSGSFAAPTVALVVTPTEFSRFLADDLDGDGRADLVYTGPNGSVVRYAFGQPDGTLSAPVTLGGGSLLRADPIVVDLDEDGQVDLALFSNDRLTFARNQGNGNFADPVTLLSGVPDDAGTPSRFLVDFDGDGELDVVSVASQRVRVWRGLGGQTFAPVVDVDDGSQILRVGALVDVDLDGDLDVIGSYFDTAVTSHVLAVAEQTAPLSLGGWQRIFELQRRSFNFGHFDLDADGDDDVIFGEEFGGLVTVTTTTLGAIGEPYCGPAVPNSTGASGTTAATGSIDLALGELRLIAESLPPGQVGYFLASRTQQITPVVPNSIGTLCLGGEIGRFVGPGQVGAADAFGRLRLQADPAAIPSPSLGSVAIVAGERWNFQAWHRDSLGGSNFTEGLTVQY